MAEAEDAAVAPHQVQCQCQQGITQVFAQKGDGIGAHMEGRVGREQLVEHRYQQGGTEQHAHKGFCRAVIKGAFEC